MQAQNSMVHRGAVTMVVGAVMFLVYAVAFVFRAFSGTGFEIGVATLNGVTPAAQPTESGCHGVHHAPPCRHCWIHRGNRRRGDWIVVVWSTRQRAVGVDHRGDFTGRGVGGCSPFALHGRFRARLGKPSRAHIRGNPDICGGGRNGADRLDAQSIRDRLGVAPVARGQLLAAELQAGVRARLTPDGGRTTNRAERDNSRSARFDNRLIESQSTSAFDPKRTFGA